ncbi:MAG: radical SAM protein [Deltaproteobacteria bacterium]|nr:radical SAM protein [Deltaproteobacteria bacterium]MDZ4343136.1 radical SAM protein [Candidatus Binatia bacterium]
MRVVLIQPPVQDFYDTDVRLQPIGLCYLKAAVKKNLPDVEVVIKDYHGGCGRRTVAIPRELRYLSDYYGVADRSPFSTFHHFYHFGKSFDDIETEITELQPNVVGISSLFTPYFREALEVAARVRKRTDAIVVMGGSHASAVPESLLASPNVGYVIRGEGERAFVEFVRYLNGEQPIDRVPSLAYRSRGEIVFNPIGDNFPIDELSFPHLSDLRSSNYQLAGKPMTFMITSRSCPHKCSFCSVHTTFGTDYRRRSLENVLEEIELRHRQGYRVIDFEDDNLTYYKNTFKEVCRRLIARFPNREMEFVAMNGISYLSLDDELLELMRQAGFSHLNLALVSSDKTVRETTKRPHTIDAYLKVVHKAQALGFKIVSYQILGLPNETLDSMIQTLAFNARLPVLLGASPFYLTPDAPIARGMNLTEPDYVKARLTALAVETNNFQRDDIYTLFVATRVINFLKGLGLSRGADLACLFDKQWIDRRTTLGFETLKLLRETGHLNFCTHESLRENKRFRPELLFRVLTQAGEIGCLNGQRIIVGEFSAPQAARKDSEARRAGFVIPVRDSCSFEHEHEKRTRFPRGDRAHPSTGAQGIRRSL